MDLLGLLVGGAGCGAEDTRVRIDDDARIAQSRGATSPHLICARSPQSSHSSAALRPRRFAQISHLAPLPPPGRRPLEKKKSRALHPPAPLAVDCAPEGDAGRERFVNRVPGLTSVKRCTSAGARDEPPSVAAAIEEASTSEAV